MSHNNEGEKLSNKQKDIVRRELEVNPLMCGGFETKLKEQFKWLGQILSSGGLSESVAATVQDREGKIRGACLEIGQIINDWRSQAVGGMDTALLLWEPAVSRVYYTELVRGQTLHKHLKRN